VQEVIEVPESLTGICLSIGLAAQQSLILKASNMVEKLEWIAKLRVCIELPKDSSMKSGSVKESKNSGNIAALSPGVSGGHVVSR
jgi:hypothetical protein